MAKKLSKYEILPTNSLNVLIDMGMKVFYLRMCFYKCGARLRSKVKVGFNICCYVLRAQILYYNIYSFSILRLFSFGEFVANFSFMHTLIS